MSAPSFVNVGAEAHQGFGQSLSLALPASLVVGNTLFAMVFGSSTLGAHSINTPSGWSVHDSLQDGSFSLFVFKRTVDGSESSPITVTWTPNDEVYGRVFQYTGVDSIGATSHVLDPGGAGANWTTAGVTTTRATSHVITLLVGNNGRTANVSNGTPSGWTAEFDGNTFAAYGIDVASSGGSSGSVSQALGISQRYSTFTIELQSVLVGGPSGTMGATEAKDVMAASATVPPGIPLYVNAGTLTHQANGTTISPALPGSLVLGNVLLCMVANGVNTGQVFTFPAGWNAIDSFHNGNLGGAWAWRFIDGSETAPAITWPLTTSADAKIWQFSGVASIGAATKLADQGFINNYSATALTTTAHNSLVVNLVYNNNNATLSGTPSGWTLNTNEGFIEMLAQGIISTGSNPTAISGQGISANARWISAEIELASVPPPIFATMAPTEAKDVWASLGSLIGGSWHSTEAKDLLSAAGFGPFLFSFGLGETPDHMAFTGVVPSIGTFDTTELPDIMDFPGEPTPPLSIDTSVLAGESGSSSTGVTSADVTITTHFKNDVIVLGIFTGGFWHQGAVTSITDTTGLFWQRRISRLVLANHLNGLTDSWFEEWWAHKPLAGPTTITVHTAETGAIIIEAVAVAGANTTQPFDTHTGAGWLRDNLGGDIIDPEGRGHFGNPAMLVYSDASHVLSIAFHASPDVLPDTSVAPGFTMLNRGSVAEGSGNTNFIGAAYRVFDTQQFGTADAWLGPDGSHISNRYLLLETLVAADQPGTEDVIRWFFDGNGNRTVQQLGVGESTVTQNMTTYRANSIAIAAVMTLSAANARVASITDDAGHLNWVRRSVTSNGSGAVSLEIWWAKFDAAFDGNITVHMDSNITPGDSVSLVYTAVAGADAFQRGEIWDSNGSLPSVNHGVTGFQTVGPFNTSNDRVLVMTWGANIDTTGNDVSLTNKQSFPFLFLQPPADLESDGPPSFHIGLEYKFSGPVVVGGVAEFDLSPAAQSWLMIADAMPVGPVSPPHGSLIVTETKDHTSHTGDFTAIGIAPSLGWVGFPPNSAAMTATETPDKTTNSGAFTAIWDINGWIAYIPAFAELSATEADDVLLDRGWVLGPRTILARMAAGEASDRLGFSAPLAFYTTPDSTGDRTSRITVTTNASIDFGTPDRLVDGSKGTNGAGVALQVSTAQPVAMFFTFDFGIPKLVTEATWYQNGNSAQPGLWVWRASDDDATWTVLSAAPFVLDAGSVGHVIGDISANPNEYRYYQLLQTTAAGGDSTPWLREIEFKVGGNSGAMAAVEAKDRFAGNMLVIPTATPIPARKRRLLIVT